MPNISLRLNLKNMQPYGTIYKITNKINGKCYVGQTTAPVKVRWRQHLSDSRAGSKLLIHKALRKYKKNNFLFEVVCMAESEQELNALEERYIKDWNTLPPFGYNLTLGGRSSKRSAAAIKNNSRSKGGHCVTAVHLHTAEVRHYSHIRDAEKDGFSSGHVRDVIAGKIKQLDGWIFVYGSVLKAQERKGQYVKKRGASFKSRKVIQVDTSGCETLFDSTYIPGFNQANVWMCCEGKQKQHKGYTFRYSAEVLVLEASTADQIWYFDKLGTAATSFGMHICSIVRALQQKRPALGVAFRWVWKALDQDRVFCSMGPNLRHFIGRPEIDRLDRQEQI